MNANASAPSREQGPVRLADQVWIAAALLHVEQPEREDFLVSEIVERAAREFGGVRPGLPAHAYSHCVANRAPSPTGYRMLFATGPNRRRLYRPSDAADPSRHGKTAPRREEIPTVFHRLLDWYDREFCNGHEQVQPEPLDAILALRGLGKEIWEGVDPDEYVRELREGWD
jgi:hypothetical protein